MLGTEVVRLLFEVLLDGDRAVQECLGELRIDLITSGRTRRLCRGRGDAADNEQADQICPEVHLCAFVPVTHLLAVSAIIHPRFAAQYKLRRADDAKAQSKQPRAKSSQSL
jgi:hypothetical protein